MRSGRSGVRTSADLRLFSVLRNVHTNSVGHPTCCSFHRRNSECSWSQHWPPSGVGVKNGVLSLFLPHVFMSRTRTTWFSFTDRKFPRYANLSILVFLPPYWFQITFWGFQIFIAPQSGYSTAHTPPSTPQQRTRLNLHCLCVFTHNNALCNFDLADPINL